MTNPYYLRTANPPVLEALQWARELGPRSNFSFLNLSQAAPTVPPPQSLLEAIARDMLKETTIHGYGPILGLPELRAEIARTWSKLYRGKVSPDQVAVTSGCNQAFVAAASVLARAGDSIILPTPWYFNHKMWLDMMGVRAVALDTGRSLVPDVDKVASLIESGVKAIVLVTPNNPSGKEYSSATLLSFFELAAQHGVSLILDETYRDFHSKSHPVHDLFSLEEWPDTLIHLYSFSKSYRLAGHRIGAVVASRRILREIEKFLDTVSICPNQIGQRAALFGLQNLGAWLAVERREIHLRRKQMMRGLEDLPGWTVESCGAYFALVEHPHPSASSETVARRMLAQLNVLTLPGTMFEDAASNGETSPGARHLRLAIANLDARGIDEFIERLGQFELEAAA